jgi:hypothetical protein
MTVDAVLRFLTAYEELVKKMASLLDVNIGDKWLKMQKVKRQIRSDNINQMFYLTSALVVIGVVTMVAIRLRWVHVCPGFCL